MTRPTKPSTARPRMPETPRKPSTTLPTVFRLLHATADTLVADRNEALHRLARLPGARLFIVRAEESLTEAHG